VAGANPSTAPATDPVTLSSILATLGLKPNTNNWAQAVLAQGGWPQTPSNVNFLQAWAAAEGGSFNNDYTYNVLNTGQSGYGGVVPAGGSFPAFPSWSNGVQATVATLNQTNGDYANITDALATGNATQQFTQGNLTSAINTWDPGGGDVQTMQENIAAPPVLTSTVTSSGGIASTGAGQFTPAGAVGAPGTTPATGSILGNCNGSTNYIKFPSALGIGGGGILTQCNVKALVSFMLIASGSLLGLAGMLLLFDRSGKLLGKSTGRAAELAGAGIGLVPGGEAVGSAVMSAGHHVSKAAGSKAPARQQPRQRVSSEDQLQAAHAQGVATGQRMGPNKPLRQRVNTGPGSRYQDTTPGAEF
jgi:hypothetical protein